MQHVAWLHLGRIPSAPSHKLAISIIACAKQLNLLDVAGRHEDGGSGVDVAEARVDQLQAVATNAELARNVANAAGVGDKVGPGGRQWVKKYGKSWVGRKPTDMWPFDHARCVCKWQWGGDACRSRTSWRIW